MAKELLLQIRNIYKSYGEKKIFEDASVSIMEKQKIGVIGRNGAGKSTLFKMIMGLEEIDKGEVQHLPELRLGYIPQVDPFTPDETIIGFLTRYTKREDWECAKTAGQFQLKGEMLNKPIGDLSGGYQMRVKLTATLLFEPNLLLLDEPTNYLDLSTLILLENFLKTFKGGFLCITHDREFIKKTCTSTMEVEHGQIVFHRYWSTKTLRASKNNSRHL
jgi:ATP-binding cassette, subfamily F, member 3